MGPSPIPAPMHLAVSRVAENAAKHRLLLAPLLFTVLGAVGSVNSPVQHSLLVTSASWAILWIPLVFRVGLHANAGGGKRSTSWLAGAFLALAHICDRAACDKDGIRATKWLLPLLVVLVSESELLSRHPALPTHSRSDSTNSNSAFEKPASKRPWDLLVTLTMAASAAMSIYTTSPTSALGISGAIFAASGLVLFETAVQGARDDNEGGTRGLMSADGSFSRQGLVSSSRKALELVALRDVAAAMTVICGIAVYMMEPSVMPGAATWEPLYREFDRDWKTVHDFRTVRQVFSMIIVNAAFNLLTFLLLLREGAVPVSLWGLFSCICAQLKFATTFSGIWFTCLYGVSALLYLYGGSLPDAFVDVRHSTYIRRILFGVTTFSVFVLLVRHASGAHHYRLTAEVPSIFEVQSSSTPLGSIPIDLKEGHPAEQLINAAETELQQLLKRQSKSLDQAVREYRRRNGIAPPPHFDKWFEFAQRRNVVMIDEFDMINQMLLPFWALEPKTIRSRIKNAIGHEDSALIAVAIRNGEVVSVGNGDEWQQQATTGMMKDFVAYLPDMDLGFNIHDEPRVVVPNDLLSSMIAKARDQVLPRAAKNALPRNDFSKRPKDLNDGKRFDEVSTSKFNRFAHQQTWTHSRLSCPTDSQAQTYEDFAADNLTSYAAGPLNYVYDPIAFSDICNSPSFSSTFGFFERPNAFSITHELTPIFSQSKVSSFQDILYPSPWYWFGKVTYSKSHDTSWENKINSLYWRGSTTGGFSRNGGWRRQHRQHIVQRINAPDTAQILVRPVTSTAPYQVKDIDRRALRHLVDVKFSHVGQCDPGDCDAQKEFFDVVERVDGHEAWSYKHLLDMDGNAFSGRFYSFLQSRSLTYKMSVFREWHNEWLKPWVHYIPVSLRGDEHLDLVRWFSGDTTETGGVGGVQEKQAGKGGNGGSLGERKAREIAERSTEWHDKVLRNADFETWFFRLLLEYGRVVDDNREEIGYPGP
ncbi:glycosyltransferase family 90 protein [Didymella exigua CBS 183.55]|uniref:Glycosyltransferase family 90 protein n=1 Tax=Didymella exigua CBS 183.55 TaxID=1150837 RepID=A0A6A5RBC9_9PLEO|nr:glycosyltransferase family 90 protein [Didymella exigua CBS 183.55]KAF1925541.1 glycosyltransferase family 90 protein [Didymella exigua CBS 183.55]